MKKVIYIVIILIIIAVAVFFLLKNLPQKESSNNPLPANQPSVTQPENKITDDFQPPLNRAGERVTKKTFAMFITPKNSPIQPEKFQGYHTGVDFEVFPEELNAEVSVRAVCSGSLKMKKYATGYGGVAVQDCESNKEPITVIYGHLKLSSINLAVGQNITIGEVIGILGANKSTETNGERKHLHLGIHKGNEINILGYVGSQAELSSWIDPCLYVCHN
jgi:murein DD-endopeptidase MepM/ murein hydrolase activator NlpD